VAHPDDESFGLGALLSALASEDRAVRVLCFTHGEASTVGAHLELGAIRHTELEDAAQALGVGGVVLHDLPDGGLEDQAAGTLDAMIEAQLERGTAAIVTFEPNGVTGHPDHRAASAAALRVANDRGATLVEWGLQPKVAAQLRAMCDVRFHSIPDGADVLDLVVSRLEQRKAIASHRSQLDDDPLVLRRLAIQGDIERIRLRPPLGASRSTARMRDGER
jgi:LmbE family N-acetylglucosaminyl deacetylase